MRHFASSEDTLQRGVYTNIGGTLAKVLAVGDFLNGKEVVGVYPGFNGLSGNQIVLDVTLENSPQGIYVATAVPEPSWVLGTLAFGTFGVGWLLKRRQKNQALTTISSSHRVVQRLEREPYTGLPAQVESNDDNAHKSMLTDGNAL